MRALLVKAVSWLLGGAKVDNDVKHYMDVFYILGFFTGGMVATIIGMIMAFILFVR
ncbi:MAG TPA: hypothetical protein VFU05_13635 [Cyclobacteriaceae bacterium]|nr:hypothetical protein [Cyclobacteriaceae bacterium]